MLIAIIGAGLSGLSCADALVRQGHEVALFDKGRGPGGRMSTRRVEALGLTLHFDHGAQYFTVRDPAFALQVADWERDGVAARWPEAGADAWVGTPSMSAPVRAMAAGHAVTWNARVETLDCDGGTWRIVGRPEAGGFDTMIIAVPAEQAASLLKPFHADFAASAARRRSAPCWTAMIAFAEAIVTETTIIRDIGAVAWATRDGAKPGRNHAETWIVQASPQWSVAHLEASPEEIAPKLLRRLEAALGMPLPAPVYLSAHRWRYARSDTTSGPGALRDNALRIGVCGDWLLAPRIEAAWLSGRLLAGLIG
ncbi:MULTISPECIES: NAD(P)/FAD-dependent oxidoreductase [Sphingosinicellaceae]|uniref:NAD(P)/FAD-dependent oxidoreductase n=1 Tax=Sphingosinicellaceae TaxID=2820280 RepID=UPI001C1DFD57|nr:MULTISPECIES: FAD-dependent oxidoreductase [Polymorphobacter]QYE33526.1 FAD-dependent oxidoreductase [Polymorphobacter sp. PAMC 29334]UAJ12221.1 FAD-dependent oxidoreductase [Polymorphobacter megasporae]